MDHRHFHKKGEKPKPVAGEAGGRWWEESPDDAANTISANLNYWRAHQQWRLMQLHRWAKQYGNLAQLGFPGMSLSLMAAARSAFGDQLTYNITQSVVDTLVSKIARNKPLPLFFTDGGDYKAQRLAKSRNRFIQGIFYENKTHKLGREALRDALVWGPGILKIFGENGRVKHERVLPSELFADELEALTGEPRQMHQIKFVDRSVLLEQYPDKEDVIRNAQWKDGASFAFNQHLADLVCVRESWRLPSSPGAGDGRHVITVNEHALTEMEEWRHDCFPFAIFRYSPRLYGFWPQGLAEQLAGTQTEINKILWLIQTSIHLAGTFKWWAKTGAGIVVEQLSNQLGAVLRSEERPEIILPTVVQAEIYAYLNTLIQRGYQLAGISQMDASSVKPTGLQSGEAIREFHDLGTERFMSVAQGYEEFYCDIARLSILAAQDVVEEAKKAREEGKEKPGLSVLVPQRGTMETVDFADLAFEPGESFHLQCFPVSALPSDPPGRWDKIQEYIQAGWLDEETGRALMDFPDIGAVEGLYNSRREFLLKTLDEMVDHGTQYTVEPAFDDLNLVEELALEYYARGKLRDVPEDRLQLLRDLITDVRQRKQEAMPQPQAALPPPANPTPTPTSPLLPNVNQPPALAA